MQAYKSIRVQTTNQVTTVTLSRPDKKNAMSFAMMHELIDAAKHIKQNKSIRAVILTGAGSDFCAGIDLTDLNQPKSQIRAFWELIKPWQSLFQRVNLCWRELPVPVIACIHGHCIGAGLQLAMACDVRVASANSKLCIMEAKWGLVADMGITQSAYGVLPVDTLKELAMTARMIEADEAKTLGLISHVVATTDKQSEKQSAPIQQTDLPQAVIDYVTILVSELKNRSPDAVLASKHLINRMHQQSAYTLYLEKMWQLKLLLGSNRKLAVKKAKNNTISFVKRQFS